MNKIITSLTTLALAGVLGLDVSAQGLLNRSRGLGGLNRQQRGGAAPAASQPTAPGATSMGTAAPGAAKVDVGGRSIEFNGAALDIVLMVYGNLVNKTVLKDPSAPAASITLQPKQGQDLTDEDKILAIETVLEMNGIHLEPYGEKFVRAMPRNKADVEVIPLIMDADAELGDTMRVVSILLSFQNIALDEAQKALEGLKSEKGSLKIYERTGQILVTDTELNVKRMREIVKKIDIATPVSENVFVRQIKYAAAADIKTALEAIVQESQKELEKQGKQANQAQQRPAFQPMQPRSLLRRPGENPPQQSKANESLFTSVSDADRGMIRGKVLILSDERSNKLIIVTAKPNMDFFDKVIEQLDVETTPDIAVKVYRLKYADAEDVSDMINDLIGNASSSKSSSRGNQNQNAKNGSGANMTRATPAAPKKSVNQRTGETKTGELSKDNTTVLADKRINGLVVMTNKDLVPTIEQIIESMDIKLSQVLIETVIIEVTLGDDLQTGIDWISRGKTTKAGDMVDSFGNKYYYAQNGDSINYNLVLRKGESYKDSKGDTWEAGDVVAKTVETARDGFMNFATGGAYALGGGGSGGKAAMSAMSNIASNFVGSGINTILKSDKLNLGAIIQASKTDSRSKYLASPIVMTVDNKKAIIDATSKHQFVTDWQAVSGSSLNGSGMPTPKYSSEDIGIKVEVTPKINPNGTVMLEVKEKYSQIGEKQKMLAPVGTTYDERLIEIPTTREMESDVLLENGQTVVFGGLVQGIKSESESGIPILKDIPWIGKWLFSSVEEKENRTELIVFMTPYVLDDGTAAQAEALRRKKTMSDSRPWEDNGWSLSTLADPVSKKEQMRRLKDEAKSQDEERKTKLAIEKWKVERTKQLKAMSKDERDLWLEMHKEELSDEAEKEELEKKMEDEGSDALTQEELKKLAASLRAKKLAEAEKEIKSADKQMSAENERGKLDAETANVGK